MARITLPKRSGPAMRLGALGLALAPLALALLSLGEPGPEAAGDAGANAAIQTGSPAEQCLRFDASPPDISDSEAFERGRARWLAACEEAHRVDRSDDRVATALARIRIASGHRDIALPLLRRAAARNDPAALLDVFELHKSWDRRADRPDLVSRAEAEASLRKAAELGHPRAVLVLTNLLDRGTIVKRDPAAARFWAERLLANPPADWSAADAQVLAGRLLAGSPVAEERARGISMLERLPASRGDAQAELARAIRAGDPVRARSLLEQAARTYPGHAVPPLAEMLIRGEGGPSDPNRAIALLSSRSNLDAAAIQGAYGRLLLEGRLVKQDIPRGIEKIHHWAVWDHDARIDLMRALASHPNVRVRNAGGLLYTFKEAAELGEPDALQALIRLKLSDHVQFGDKAGACDLLRLAGVRDPSVPAEPAPSCPAQ